jgi:hypothetical protein
MYGDELIADGLGELWILVLNILPVSVTAF